MSGLLIGEVAERAGVAAPTIRYYESIGLLKPAARSTAGYRRYSDETLEELGFIRKAQALGSSLDEIGEIMKLTEIAGAFQRKETSWHCKRVRSIAALTRTAVARSKSRKVRRRVLAAT